MPLSPRSGHPCHRGADGAEHPRRAAAMPARAPQPGGVGSWLCRLGGARALRFPARPPMQRVLGASLGRGGKYLTGARCSS